MMNVQWKKPHAVFFGEIILLPGLNGNDVTPEQLATLEGDKTFKECKKLGLAVVSEEAVVIEVEAKDEPKATVAKATLRTDGPTLKMFLASGYAEEGYPPEGYAVRVDAEADAKVDADAQAEAEAQAKAATDAMAEADAKAAAEAQAKTAPEVTPLAAAPVASAKAESKKKG